MQLGIISSNDAHKYNATLYNQYTFDLSKEQQKLYQRISDLQAFVYLDKRYKDKVTRYLLGVDFRLKTIEVEMIEIKPSERNKGLGRAIITQLIKFCDTEGFRLVLVPDENFGTPLSVLKTFYTNLGFKKPRYNDVKLNDPYANKWFKLPAKNENTNKPRF